METVDISNKPLMELKAMAYDVLTQIDLFQRNLNALNSEIQKKLHEPKAEEGIVEKTN